MDLLPRELWEHVAGFLTYDDVRSLSCTCKALAYLSRRRYIETFVFEVPSNERPIKGRVNFTMNKQTYFLYYELKYSCIARPYHEFKFTCRDFAISSVLFFGFDNLDFESYYGLEYEAERKIAKCGMYGADRKIYDGKIVVKFKFYPYSYSEEDAKRANERKIRRKGRVLERFIKRQPFDRVYTAT